MYFPQLLPGFSFRKREFQLQCEPAGKCRVDVVQQIGGGDERSLETLEGFEEEVLHLVIHPVHRSFRLPPRP